MRMKPATSCQACRRLKRKCLRRKSEGECEACLRTGKICSFTNRGRCAVPPITVASNVVVNGLKHEPIIVQQDIAVELVEHYIHYLHDKPHSLFHPPTLRYEVHKNTINKALLYSLCAMGCRFSKHPTVRGWTSQLTLASKNLLKADLDKICMENIQTCIIVANLCAAELDSSSEALFFAIAIRMAHILEVTSPNPTDSVVDQEVKRRVWWSLFMADRWCSSGLGLPRQISDTKRPTRLPMDEDIFQRTSKNEMVLPGPWRPGLWSYMITLAEIFENVHDLHLRLINEAITEDSLDNCVEELAFKFELWQDKLPQELHLSEENLDRYRKKNLGNTFVALHLGYHHYATLLYFQYLDSRRSMAETYAQRCRFHASEYSSLLKMARSKGDCEIVYATTGHMTVVSSSVLLYNLLFGEEHQIVTARASLASNFAALVELKSYWPHLEKWIKRLFVFQNMCLNSQDFNPHKIDTWMIRFLLTYSAPLEERSSGQGEARDSGLHMSPTSLSRLRDREQMVNTELEVLR